jgi:exodeoxyribonuclease-1
MAAASLFFYDLETSGINPRSARIMQFAGQRTDLKLKPIGEPVNLIVKLSDDVLPEPDAIMITGITPQQTKADGITEAEFLKIFSDEVATPGTIFTGFNSVRFDDEFMRYLHYRNFYDPYEWQWQDDRGRWDLLDVVRLTRALRPDGIQWPFEPGGKPSNRLELLTSVNNLEHTDAHDALSDVRATIAVARLIYNKQTKLFEYLLSMRGKKAVAGLVDNAQPFVYASGKYPAEFEKTTVVVKLSDHPERQGALVYDLRHDPSQYLDKSASQLAELWRWKKDSKEPRLPVKTLQYNRVPAVAPIGVLDTASQKRLQIDLKQFRPILPS